MSAPHVDLLGQIVAIGGLEAVRSVLRGALASGPEGLATTARILLEPPPPPHADAIRLVPTPLGWHDHPEDERP